MHWSTFICVIYLSMKQDMKHGVPMSNNYGKRKFDVDENSLRLRIWCIFFIMFQASLIPVLQEISNLSKDKLVDYDYEDATYCTITVNVYQVLFIIKFDKEIWNKDK